MTNQQHKFDRTWAEIENLDNDLVKSWINRVSLEFWTLLHDGGRRWGDMTSNMVEIFNSVLKGAHFLLITALVQLTFYRVNCYFAVRREQGEVRLHSSALFTTTIKAKLTGLRVKANGHEVQMYHHNPGLFEVKTTPACSGNQSRCGRVHVIHLGNRTCSCIKWQIYHHPCSHVLAACASRKIDALQFVDEFYSMQNYMKSWAPTFHAIPDKFYWPTYNGPTLIPDENMRRNIKGRPKSTHIHNEMDARDGGHKPLACGLCGNTGHNRRSCPNRNQ